MAKMKLRVSGSWVDTNRSGKVNYQGSDLTFGPSGPLYEAIDWLTSPALTDADDGPTTTYNMGCSFTVVSAKLCYGVRWRVPDSVITPPTAGSHYVTLFQVGPTVEMGQKAFTPVVGGYQDILFDTPFLISPGNTYIASVLTVKYVFRAASSVGGFPLSSPSGNVVADFGRLAETGDPDVVPGSSFASIYYVSPLVAT